MHEQMYGPYNLSRPVHVVDPQRSWKPNVEIAPNCPRCDSSNTKFCYYNNYSLTQPRYFCKGCRRYWTKGGSLRNVPVGGGCRKKRRAKSSSSSSLRVSTSSGVNPSSRSRSSPVSDSSRALRPDLALDDMVGGSHRSIGIGMDDASTVTDGSGIDLAVLYSNFLNQSPQQAVNVSGGDLVGSSSSSDQVGLIGDFDYSFDPNGYESLSLPNVQLVDDVFFSTNPSSHVFQNLAAWQAAPPERLQQSGFCAVSDVVGQSRHHHHHQDLMGGDWCPPSIGQSSFGAF